MLALPVLRLTAVLILLTTFVVAPSADASTRRHHKRSAFAVALQPFETAHAVVHSVAGPVVHAATEPLRIAYYAARPPVIRGEPVGDIPDEEETAPVARDFDAAPEVESNGAHPTVNGSTAIMRGGIAYAPSHAPQRVKDAIWAVNTIRHKPYTWGGGHGSFFDRGYDCSGTVSFALHYAGVLNAPLPSSDLLRYGERGRGRWITVYSRPGHTFAVIAGLRLDTTDFNYGGDVGPRWHTDARDTRGFAARHPAGL